MTENERAERLLRHVERHHGRLADLWLDHFDSNSATVLLRINDQCQLSQRHGTDAGMT